MSKPSFTYASGSDPREYASPEAFCRYAHRLLGVEIPVARFRTGWYKRLKEEMQAQGWDWDDMAKAVRYMKAHNIHAKRMDYILYHVQKARTWVEEVDSWELQGKVADALKVETDEIWRRRLALARGPALAKIYGQWVEERA